MSKPALSPLYRNFPKLLIILAVCVFDPGASAIAKDEIEAEIRFLYVQPGQTLHNIVRRLYPERPNDWEKLKRQIVRDNPQAFINGDESRLVAGERLDLPRRMVVKPRPVVPSMKQVGEVLQVRGEVVAVGASKASRDLGVGDGVFVGDKIVTGEDGFVRMQMIDNAKLDLRCYSIMVIEKYDVQAKSRGSILNLLQGSLRKETGEIGKKGEDTYELKTPVASVGVRGTRYALRVFQSKGCDGSVDTGDEGLYIKVIDGIVDVHNKAAKTEVVKNDTLYIPLPDKAPVRKDIEPGVIEPVKDGAKEDKAVSPWWWAVLGAIALALAL